MSDQEELLQESLLKIESGKPVEEVISQLPAGSEELVELIRTASAVRQLAHPTPLPADYQEARQRVLRSAGDGRPPISGIAYIAYLINQLGSFRAPPFTAAFIILILCLASTAGAGLYLAGPAGARSVTLMDVTGLVEVSSSPAQGDWQPVDSGGRAYTGQTIHTDASSSVTLLFFEGSRTVIGPNSDVELSKLSGGWNGRLNVALTENAGATRSSVVPFNGKASAFIVHTPSGAASVQGTRFDVDVSDTGLSRYTVTNGEVQVQSDHSQVEVAPGQAVISALDGGLDHPAYQFFVQGTLTSIQDDIWIVDGVVFRVTAHTEISGEPQLGDLLSVQGRILDKDDWVADTIQPAEASDSVSTFTGIVDSIGAGTWVIGGVSVQITTTTQISQGIAVNDPVKVAYVTLADGSRVAVQIELLQAAPNPSAKPELGFQPSGLASNTCVTSTLSLNGTLINHGEGPGDVAANVELGYVIEQGAGFVDQVSLEPAAYTTVGPGKKAPFKINIGFTPAWQDAHQGSTVKLRVFITRETNRPDHLNARLNVVIKRNCKAPQEITETPVVTDIENTPTPTVTVTPTLTPTATITATLPTPTPTITGTLPTPTPTVTPLPTRETARCDNQRTIPEAVKLAKTWGVTPEEIMSWFCQGFGFGEIDLAYSLAHQANVPVATVFDLRKSGLGWGQIKQQLGGKPGQGNGNDQGNQGNQGNNGNPNQNKKNKP